jgi:dTDP-4-amino-4,6-dideoxygalactose transaminase|tara:strand:+ start:9700 stop:10827 length:1128 start_codon:yes stop_codon:yes gene_type:complete
MEKIAPNKLTRLSKSVISDLEKQAVIKVLDNGFLGMGSEVKEFEDMLSDFFGRPAVCVSNGTAALQLALQAYGVSPGDEVIVQSLTYVASFQAITAIGAIPVACDVDPETLCMNWRDVEKRITKKTKVLMPVHYSGGVGELDNIYRIAKNNHLIVIEDAAHAFGTTYKGLRVGGFGDIACFSFDGIKNITCGEGGCVVSSDLDFLNKVRNARLLGVENDSQKRYLNKRSWDFEVSNQGWRYHMSNIMAAIGIEQLKRFTYLSKKRQKLALQYTKLLSNVEGITLIDHNYDHVVPHIFTIRFSSQSQRDHVMERLKDNHIQFGLHYKPNHFLSKYRTHYILKNVELAYSQLLSLPLHPDLEDSDIDFICDIVQKKY